MLYKTSGIVLHSIKYGDTSCIAHIYTEKFGRQSFLVKGAYNKKATVKASLFYPLNILEMEIYHKPNANLQKIKEAQNFPIYQQIPFHSQKSTIAFFLAEILYKTLHEEEANSRLFHFIYSALQMLDLKTTSVANFHLIFMLQLSKFGGFFPNNNCSQVNSVFDLLNGSYVSEIPAHQHFIPVDESKIFSTLINKGLDQLDTIKLSREMRQFFLNKLIEFYQLHIEGMGNINSLGVLKEIFDI